jgi:hypothetical protein
MQMQMQMQVIYKTKQNKTKQNKTKQTDKYASTYSTVHNNKKSS